MFTSYDAEHSDSLLLELTKLMFVYVFILTCISPSNRDLYKFEAIY